METSEFGIGELIRRAVPVSESNGRLVGFGRAVSDCGLTASIYDVAVSRVSVSICVWNEWDACLTFLGFDFVGVMTFLGIFFPLIFSPF